MKYYSFKQVSSSTLSRGADGKYSGTKTVVSQETDDDGNLKDVEKHEYELDEKGCKWVETKSISDKKNSECCHKACKTEKTEEKAETPKEKSEEELVPGTIFKLSYAEGNEYFAVKDKDTAYWLVYISKNPLANYFEEDVDISKYSLQNITKATRDEVLAVEKFIARQFGAYWDWKEKEVVHI